MYTLTGYTLLNQVFYTKTWDKEPSRKTLRMLKERYDLKYGAYLCWSFKKPEDNQVPSTQAVVA